MIRVIGHNHLLIIWWSESVRLQTEKYPRFGSFKKNDMELMKSMVKGGWVDPQWDYKYMGESYEILKKI